MQTPSQPIRLSHIKPSRLVMIAGSLLIVFSVGHFSLSLLFTAGLWQNIISAGLWNSVPQPVGPETLSMSLGARQLQTAYLFWLTPASFSLPLLCVGLLVVWMNRRGIPLPRFLGWLTLVFAMIICVMLPLSPIWLALSASVMLIVAPYLGRATHGTESSNR